MGVKYLSLLWVLVVAGCSTIPTVPQLAYAAIHKQHLETLGVWSLSGRIAITSPYESWSANMTWQRASGEDNIQLSGPLGQGAVNIHLALNEVTVDRGDGNIQRSNNPDEFVTTQLGVFVPVRSLAYWVIGLPAPTEQVVYAEQGFSQKEWQVEYKEWQAAEYQQMPRKIVVTNGKLKLKLICDQWEIKK